MNKRKRKGIHGPSGGNVMSFLMQTVLPAAGGFLLADLATKNLSFLSNNPTLADGVKVAGGVLLALQGGMLGGLAAGVAANGVVNLAKPLVNLNGIGLLPPGTPSRYLAGLSGSMTVPASPPVDQMKIQF